MPSSSCPPLRPSPVCSPAPPAAAPSAELELELCRLQSRVQELADMVQEEREGHERELRQLFEYAMALEAEVCGGWGGSGCIPVVGALGSKCLHGEGGCLPACGCAGVRERQ